MEFRLVNSINSMDSVNVQSIHGGRKLAMSKFRKVGGVAIPKKRTSNCESEEKKIRQIGMHFFEV